MTKDQIIQALAKRLAKKPQAAATWGDLVSSVQAFTPSQKATLLAKLTSGDFESAGKQLAVALRAEVTSDVVAEATAMLADDQLSLAEIERIL